MNLLRRVTAELIGTAFLLAVVVGSGIMGERLANGNAAISLHHRGLLVHFINIVRQPGGDYRQVAEPHVRRYPAGRRAGLHPGPASRGRRRHNSVLVDSAFATG